MSTDKYLARIFAVVAAALVIGFVAGLHIARLFLCRLFGWRVLDNAGQCYEAP